MGWVRYSTPPAPRILFISVTSTERLTGRQPPAASRPPRLMSRVPPARCMLYISGVLDRRIVVSRSCR